MPEKRVTFAVAVYLLLPSLSASGETLQEAMIAAMQHYPPVLAEAARRQAAQVGVGIARAGYLPRTKK